MSWTDAMKVALTVGAARKVKYRVHALRAGDGWYYIASPVPQ